MPAQDSEALQPISNAVVETLVGNYRAFLDWLARRTGGRAAAEEILQAAFARAVEKGVPAADGEGAVNWFYAVLRNALIDHYRRRGSEDRALAALAGETPETADPEMRAEVCACFRRLLPTLKPEYAAMIEAVDLGERPVAEVAREAGITANNAGVRLFRAREALRRQLERSCGVCARHGCLDCRCGARPPA